MDTLEKQDVQQLEQIIDSVKTVNNTDVILIVNTETQEKMFKELLQGYKVICAYGSLENDDKVYILPDCDQKQELIKIKHYD